MIAGTPPPSTITAIAAAGVNTNQASTIRAFMHHVVSPAARNASLRLIAIASNSCHSAESASIVAPIASKLSAGTPRGRNSPIKGDGASQ